MTISKKIINDKKEKHNSFELIISVPTMRAPDFFIQDGGFVEDENTIYTSFYSSEEDANKAFDSFLTHLSAHFKRSVSSFKINDELI